MYYAGIANDTRVLALIGVPSSAGAFAPGQELAPGALRAAGLVERLHDAGLAVVDRGDVTRRRWKPEGDRRALAVPAVVDAVREVAAALRGAVSDGQFPLVLGGDCTIELGTILGHDDEGSGSVGLVYFDLHPDLNVPGQVAPGALDWMGMAHALGEPGTADELREVAGRTPLIAPDRVAFLAYGPDQMTPCEQAVFQSRGLAGVPVEEVHANPAGSAARALELVASAERVLVHFDVDTVDFLDLPLSENTGHNIGLPFETAVETLGALLADHRSAALTVTELNPLHGEEDGSTIERFVTALVKSLARSPALR